MKTKVIGMVVFLALVMSVACSHSGQEVTGQSQGVGMSLTILVGEGTDVGAMRFVISPCEGGDALVDEVVPLEPTALPASLISYNGTTYDPESQHHFADFFVALPPGCYNVMVQPMMLNSSQQWEPSSECASANEEGVMVEPEQTTEVLFISQCLGDEIGGIDAIASLNHEPEIKDLVFEPSKFVTDCTGTVVCVIVSDPDCDPLEIVWMQTSGPELEPTPVSRVREGCEVTECVRFQPTEVASYEFEVQVYDLLIEGELMVRIEDWLYAHGYGSDSHAQLGFPLYSTVECPIPLPPPPPDPPCGCTLSMGYWKTHNSEASEPSQQIDWPAPLDEFDLLCGATLLEILWMPSEGGDAVVILAKQYIAALLNMAAGASSTMAVDDALNAAAALLESCEISAEDRAFAMEVKDVLDEYNNGLRGPGYCCQC